MYEGYLASFYKRFREIDNSSYNDHYKTLINDTTEVVASYIKGFRKLGTEADFTIGNDENLLSKWRLENGLKSSDTAKTLYEQVKRFRPDILWIDNLNMVDTRWLKEIRSEIKSIKLIVGSHCAPYGSKILENLRLVDLVITCTPGLNDEMQRKGIRSRLVYHGFDTTLIKRIDTNNLSVMDFIFSGSLIHGGGFHNERIKLIESILKEKIEISLYADLEKNYRIHLKQTLYYLNKYLKPLHVEKLKLFSFLQGYDTSPVINYSGALKSAKKDPVYGIDMYNLFSKSKIVLNYHIGVAGNFAGNMRLFEVTGVGSCLLTDNKMNMSEIFDTDNEVVVYDNADDCIRKAKWLLEHEEDRKRISQAGHERTLRSHSIENRCNLLVAILNEELRK